MWQEMKEDVVKMKDNEVERKQEWTNEDVPFRK